MGFKIISSLNILLLLVAISQSGAILDPHYYDKTCPQAENIINQAIRNATKYDPKVPSYSENSCPKTVSCADIIAIAARDVVVLSGGPNWSVLKGRKDGRISRANETINLPAPSSNTSQLIQSFSQRGLSAKDLVALSGGHTLGFSHCSSFEARLRNFSSTHDSDPTLNPQFAAGLKSKCPKPNTDRNAGQFLDSTSSVFDNDYYRRVVGGKGVFVSDQSLLGDYRDEVDGRGVCEDQGLFFGEFARAMVRLGSVGVVENGEVRKNCRVVN
ncbi:hypothetical protein DH2020_048671 [Rehmannia glutinosa]|uniref:Plant heme peroxidase family profile domain-containing protein n=1 Tax=Rehmannia glutinosa TaxID=99300 RepID=A0ABR0U503_REHGL